MKKFILTTAMLTALPVATAIAAAPNNVGCGLGSMIFEGQSGIVPQILAVTTNGTFGNQTFGITSGTLGCAKNGVVSVPEKVALFADENLDKLAHNMAVGGGETLSALATLMEVEAQDKPAFFNAVKTHFAQIFSNENVTSTEVLVSMNDVLSADPLLKRYSYS
ncbi:DUF3015 domain-containing protein [Candidatus Parabeggiatoa sp. HSG14]|uniref:DUF3015 domain-containing protein n=1 Tax=Candidatus Parabeggiatoa sp. HSG14 TaxID=3055593 RepID=UPI0025A6B6DC|nr:DUF3015 domain-containing protein [Thiotrichales bacterium HSG14]